jgi:hypothetical protein
MVVYNLEWLFHVDQVMIIAQNWTKSTIDQEKNGIILF